jgi:hypothetical protein
VEEEEEPAKWAPWAPGLELLPGLLLLPGRLLLLLLLLLLGLLLLKALPKSPTPPHLGTSGASTSMADESGMMAEPACVCVLMCVHACMRACIASLGSICFMELVAQRNRTQGTQ